MKLHWGNAIFIFFVLFLSLAAVFIIFSLKQNNDLEDENYYEKGAAYDDQIEINRRSIAYADSIYFKQDASSVSISFASYLLLNCKSIKVHFYRPSNQIDDLIIETKPDQPIVIDKASLTSGRYIVKFTWKMNVQDYGCEKDYFVE